MKAVVQIVKSSKVSAEGRTAGAVKYGLLVLLGVCAGDGRGEAELLAKKTANLRIFSDNDGKMNLSVIDAGGSALVVSNFTLCADTKKGSRPSYSGAMNPADAEKLYLYFAECLKSNGVTDVQTGKFGADMSIDARLDGPVTVILDTDVWRKA